MKVKYKDSIEYKALQRLKKIRSNVVLRKDFDGLGSYRQISRVLSRFVKNERLVKLGVAVYAKLIHSKITQASYLKEGMIATMRAVLNKFNICWEASKQERDYNAGQSTQIPVNPTTTLKDRFRRKLSYRDMEFKYE